MKRMIQAMLAASLLLGLQAMPAQATIDKIVGEVCTNCGANTEYPVRQGQTTIVTVEGQFVDLSTALEVSGSGVTVSSASGSSSSKKRISIVVAADAAPGLRTVKLRYAVEVNGPDTFKIEVVRNGRVTDVDVPSPSQFFNNVDVVLSGNNIDNAGVITSGFGPALTATVAENTASRAVVRLQFSGSPLAEASGTIFLFDKSCELCNESNSQGFLKLRYDGVNPSGANPVSILGPNAVSSITFPDGSSVRVGSLLSIKVKLVRPARAAPAKRTSIFGPPRAVGTGGVIVHWQLVPSSGFEAAPGSGISFSPTGLNQVRVPAGDEFVILTVRLAQVPSGCPLQGCTGEIQTRMNELNTDQPPFFKKASFTMLPPAI